MNTTKQRKQRKQRKQKEEMTAASFTSPLDLLLAMDERAAALDMSRAQYIRALVRRDLDQDQMDHQMEQKKAA